MLVCGVIIALLVLQRTLRTMVRSFAFYGPRIGAGAAEPADLPPDTAFRRVASFDGAPLGVYSDTSGAHPPGELHEALILYSHGTNSCCESSNTDFVANIRRHSIMWDYRGFGRSAPERTDEHTSALDLCALTLGSYDETRHGDRFVMVGKSLGVNISLHYVRYALTHKHMCLPLPRLLILCHPFLSLRDVFAHLGVPTVFATVCDPMCSGGFATVRSYLQTSPTSRVVFAGTVLDTITPWTSLAPQIDALRDEFGATRVHVAEVGGLHFQFPPPLWALLETEIHEFLLSCAI